MLGLENRSRYILYIKLDKLDRIYGVELEIFLLYDMSRSIPNWVPKS